MVMPKLNRIKSLIALSSVSIVLILEIFINKEFYIQGVNTL